MDSVTAPRLLPTSCPFRPWHDRKNPISSRHFSAWARDQRCRILAEYYETEYGCDVYVPEQIGEIVGWHFCERDGTEPVAVKIYVRVQK